MYRWLQPPGLDCEHESGRGVRFRRFELAPRALRKGFAQRSRDVEPPLFTKNGRRLTQEGGRGRASAMRRVAAVRAL